MPGEGFENIMSNPQVACEYLRDFEGVGPFIYKSCKKYAQKIAQIDSKNEAVESFQQLNERSVRCALELKRLGVKPGDVITVCSFNTIDIPVPTIGGLYVGAILSFLDPTLSQQTTAHLLNEVKPKIIFCGQEAVELITSCLCSLSFDPILVVFDDIGYIESNLVPFLNFVDRSVDCTDFVPFKPNSVKDTAVIIFSSGTTGLSKGICLHHYGLISAQATLLDILPGCERCLHFTSFYWISGIGTFLFTFFEGLSRVIVPYFDVTTSLAVLEKYKVNFFITSTINVQYLKPTKYKDYDFSSMKFVGIGGTPTSTDVMKLARDIFPKALILHGYGMTEQSGIMTIFNPDTDRDFILNKPGSCGKILPGISAKIVDVRSEEMLGPNQHGELRIKSASIMNGYYGRDASSAWDSDGWLCTGDVCYYDQDGCFYVVDRIKDMLKFQSWHVTPSAIEAVLMKHSKVKEAVVVGIPHEVDGDLAMGIVVLYGNNTDSVEIERELLEFVDDRMGYRDRLHGGLKIVESIPRTPSGKTRRRDIRNMALEGLL